MSLVSGTFRTTEAVDKAMEELRLAGYDETDMWVQEERLVENKPGDYPDNYDPIGGARMTGTPVLYPFATAGNLIGNSVTIDLELSDLPRILEAVANDEEARDGDERPLGRLVLQIDAGDRSYEVATILKRNRARNVRVHNR